jgi:hypothetical protein
LNEKSKEGWIERRPDQELMDVGIRVSQLNQSNAKRVAARQATVARDLWLAPAMALARSGKRQSESIDRHLAVYSTIPKA